MKKFLYSFTFFAIFALVFPQPGSVRPWLEKVDAWVLESAAAQGETEFLVLLKEQADLSAAERLPSKQEKGAYVYAQLTQTARRTQAPLLSLLQQSGVEHRPYWVANMIWVRGDRSVVEMLARRSDVARLHANPSVRLQAPEKPLAAEQGGLAPSGIEWNLLKVRADLVWAAGFNGQGAVIGGQDTGYDWQHPALINSYRGWNGQSASHAYNWYDAIHQDDPHTLPGNPCGFDSPFPCDDGFHGTHTMGTMVGDDGQGNQVGMAPGAKWIGCRNMEQGWGMPSTYSECYQWFIAPWPVGGDPFTDGDPSKAPDVINNSWSCPTSEGCTQPDILLAVVNNVRAAGILTAHSAGNSGSSCSTVNTPAAIYDASFTVGNTTSSDVIASLSSRGPVTIDGSGRLKPDISAPGTNIRSSVPGSGYGIASGTSMAAPHVAGLAALLISARPSLSGQVDQLEFLITRSAIPLTTSQTCGGVPGSSIPNNTYGWGRIDAWNAYQSLDTGLQLRKTAHDALIQPGERITYTLTVSNTHPYVMATSLVLSDEVPTDTFFITATLPHTLTGNLVEWSIPNLAPLQSITRQLVVGTPLNPALGYVVNQAYSVVSAEYTPVHGIPVETFFKLLLLYFPLIRR